VLIGGSQKAVMVPPGLAYCSVSDRAWQRMETTKNPRYYFDLRKERKNGAKGESSYTPSTALVAALAAALDYIREQGSGDLATGAQTSDRQRGNRGGHDTSCGQSTRTELFSASSPGAALTAIAAPEGVDSKRYRKSVSQPLWRDRRQWTRRDERPAFPHCASGYYELSGHHRRHSARWSRYW